MKIQHGFLLVFVIVGVVTLPSREANAQRKASRRSFEPTDLDLKGDEGSVECDLQGGFVKGDSGRRVVAPDVEATLGLSSDIEIEIDTTLGYDQSLGPRFHFIENTWASLKLGIFDVVDHATKSAWAGGVQVGPKLPTLPGSRGIGTESLAIVGRTVHRVHVFSQAGFLLDPYTTDPIVPRFRPFGLEGGFDVDIDLDSHNEWSFKGELGGTHLFAPRSNEVHITAGVACQVAKWLELSLIGVGGLGAGDHYGALFGASPQFKLF